MVKCKLAIEEDFFVSLKTLQKCKKNVRKIDVTL